MSACWTGYARSPLLQVACSGHVSTYSAISNATDCCVESLKQSTVEDAANISLVCRCDHRCVVRPLRCSAAWRPAAERDVVHNITPEGAEKWHWLVDHEVRGLPGRKLATPSLRWKINMRRAWRLLLWMTRCVITASLLRLIVLFSVQAECVPIPT